MNRDDAFCFALELEAIITEELKRLQASAPPELTPIVQYVLSFQKQFECIIKQAPAATDAKEYPSIDTMHLFVSDAHWQSLASAYTVSPQNVAANLAPLWLLVILMEKSEHYYHQFALNSMQPAAKLFISSLKETKTVMKRKMESILRISSNKAWERVGFAPFLLGKDY